VGAEVVWTDSKAGVNAIVHYMLAPRLHPLSVDDTFKVLA
jgi:hypothetical protein